ncbi:MAG: hypothetical protein P4L31_00175 [Candidatus Babeliales bacterium]|nr:hypothetical protein [Candidatus Babeliales bacterium]
MHNQLTYPLLLSFSLCAGTIINASAPVIKSPKNWVEEIMMIQQKLAQEPYFIRDQLSAKLIDLNDWQEVKKLICKTIDQHAHVNPNNIYWKKQFTLYYAQENKDADFILWLSQHNDAETGNGQTDPFLEKATETLIWPGMRPTPVLTMEKVVPLLQAKLKQTPSNETLSNLCDKIKQAQALKLDSFKNTSSITKASHSK